MTSYAVYSLPHCPHCIELKNYFIKMGIEFKEYDLEDIEVLTDLRCDGVFVAEAPILKAHNKYFSPSELFEGGSLNTELLDAMVEVCKTDSSSLTKAQRIALLDTMEKYHDAMVRLSEV